MSSTNQRRILLASAFALVTAAATIATGVGCDHDSNHHGNQPWCHQPDGPYEGAAALYAAICDAIDRCDCAAQLGYAFACRQECVQTFTFGMACGFSDEEDPSDRYAHTLVEREVTYDPVSGDACADWLESAACADVQQAFSSGALFDSDTTGGTVPDACHSALVITDPNDGPAPGSVAEGEACEWDDDCQEGLFCEASSSGGEVELCRVCAPLPGPGMECLEGACGMGAWCDYEASPQTCVATKVDGSDCTTHAQCTSGRCDASICITPLADGETCDHSGQCESQLCHGDLCIQYATEGEACDADQMCSTGRCFQDECIRIRDIDEECTDSAQCYYTCYRGACAYLGLAGDPCDTDDNCGSTWACYESVCTSKTGMPIGAPCGANGYTCASGLCLAGFCAERRENGVACASTEECLSGVCHQNLCGYPNGESCTYGSQCRSDRCVGYVCATPVADGQPCTEDAECLSWYCLDNFCFTPVAEGGGCTRSDECESGLYCDATAIECTPQVANGEPCVIDDQCDHTFCDPGAGVCGHPAGFECVADWQCAGYCNGVCADKQAEGAACSVDKQCLGYCVNGHCVTLKPYGATCSGDDECAGGICEWVTSRSQCRGPDECLKSEDCEAGEFCDDWEYPNICTPQKADGESCDEDVECIHLCYSHSCVEKKPEGASCTEDSECSGGLCRYGSCTVIGACSSDDDCTPPQFCDRNLYRPTCADPRADGGACDHDTDCLSGWCSFITDTCKPQPRLGDACQPFECTPDAFCSSGLCIARKGPGEACDDTDLNDAECLGPYLCRRGRCELMPLECSPAPVGSICTLLSVCTADAYCDVFDGFTCTPRAAVGAACESSYGPNDCAIGSHCVSGTCDSYVEVGGSCAEHACHPATSFCDGSSVCQPLKYAGESCSDDSECLSDECSGDVCYGGCKMP